MPCSPKAWLEHLTHLRLMAHSSHAALAGHKFQCDDPGWVSGRGSSPEGGQIPAQAAQGNGRGLNLPEPNEHLDNALSHKV